MVPAEFWIYDDIHIDFYSTVFQQKSIDAYKKHLREIQNLKKCIQGVVVSCAQLNFNFQIEHPVYYSIFYICIPFMLWAFFLILILFVLSDIFKSLQGTVNKIIPVRYTSNIYFTIRPLN